MIFCFDLDNTICFTKDKDYANSKPDPDMVKIINSLYDESHVIKIYTSRGMGRFLGDVKKVYEAYFKLTKDQLDSWKIKYHELLLGKPSYDFFIDDKNLSIEDIKKQVTRGVVAGSFDVIHPGYLHMFKEAKKYCTHLTVLLHEDPSLERYNKLKPLLSVEDRKQILLSIKYIDDIKVYDTESALVDLLSTGNYSIRFLGDDYFNLEYTGKNLPIKVHFINRDHGWSTTKFKTRISESLWTK